jgi:hypothetical protein
MKKKIEVFEFTCDLEYLHNHKKEFSSGSIFIIEIKGFNCHFLKVKFIKLREDD